MPNPYHDETGKFCSKEEMQTAIANLGTKGDMDGYFKLRTEFENIVNNKIAVSKDTIRGLIGHTALLKHENSDNYQSIYETFKETLKEPGRGNQNQRVVTALTFLEADLDTATKQELISELDAETKAELLDRLQSNNSYAKKVLLTSEETKAFLKGQVNKGVLVRVFGSEMLTFEDKYNAAKSTPHGLTVLAEEKPKLFFNEPALSQELYEQAQKEAATNSPDVEKYTKALALSPNPEHHAFAIEHTSAKNSLATYNNSFSRLIANPHLTNDNAKTMLTRIMNEDIESARPLVGDMMQNFRNVPHLRKINNNFRTILSGEGTYDSLLTKNYSDIEKADKEYKTLRDIQVKRPLSPDEHRKLISVTAMVHTYAPKYRELVKQVRKPKHLSVQELDSIKETLYNTKFVLELQEVLRRS